MATNRFVNVTDAALKYETYFCHFYLIILKQLFTSGSVTITEYSPHFVSVSIHHRYLLYTRWCIPHCGQAKIEARSQALVVPTELTRSMIICVFCIAEMDQVDNKSSFMQLKSIKYTNEENYSVFVSIF